MLKRLFIFIGVFGIIFLFSQNVSAKLTDLIPIKGTEGTTTGTGADKATRPSAVPKGFASVQNVVTLIFNTIITISGVIFLIMLLIGGIQYLTGAGNEEATGKAKKMMIDAIVGLIIVLASWAIGTWILGRLGGTATTTAPASTPGSTSTTTPPPSSTPSSTPTTSPTSYDWNIGEQITPNTQYSSVENDLSFEQACYEMRGTYQHELPQSFICFDIGSTD